MLTYGRTVSIIFLEKEYFMDMDTVKLAEELGELGKNVNRKAELEPRLRVSETDYLAMHLPVPRAKSMVSITVPSKTRLIRTGCFFLAFLVLGLVLLFSAISSFSKDKKLTALYNDRGTEYQEWLNSFGTVSTFDELEDGWKTVEKAWKKRGVDVDWDFVVSVKNGIHSTVIYSDVFDRELFRTLQNEKDHATAGSTKITFFVFTLIPLIIFAINTKARYGEYCDAVKKMEENTAENEQRKTYNDTELPKLLAEREEKLPQVRAEYEDAINTVRSELSEIEAEIVARAHLLPLYYHKHAIDIALILVRGRADTLKEAINIFEEERRAEEMARIERQRAEDEARHRQAMEYETRRAAEQAHQDALAQQRMMRDQMVAEQQARR